MTKSVTAPLVAVGTAAIKFSSDSQDAFQQFAAATGTASNEMGKYKDMINDVYKDNFGESINDVAEAMATVNQNMSYLDDSALQRCTEYAYTLSDTFGVDVAESTRAADSLIKNYGVSAREAFNLMTQGMQSGLNFRMNFLIILTNTPYSSRSWDWTQRICFLYLQTVHRMELSIWTRLEMP